MKSFVLAVFLACFILVYGERAQYDNYRVYSTKIKNEDHLKILKHLETSRDGISFMEPPNAIQQNVDIIVPPHKFASISELFETYKIEHSIKIDNLQKLIDMEQPPQLCSDFSWNQYNDLSVFYKWLDKLLERYPKIVTGYTYGSSYEGRPLRAVKVSHKQGNPTIFIESTIHAREWITAATTAYFLNELLTSRNGDIQNLANNYDWVIVPVMNVDGYEYTHKKDRMWRKNRTPSAEDPLCIGTDLNRNFDFHHGETGASNQPCAETYAGPKAFSEPETLALSKFIKGFDNIRLYLSFHSYSQLLMFPYGYTKEHAANFDDLNQVGKKTIQAIQRRFGTSYVTGSIAETIYLASGSSIDWVYATQNVSLTYTFEFRDKGRYGFILPANQIVPNSLEVIDGLVAMIEEAKSLHYL